MAKDRVESKYFRVAPGIELHYLETVSYTHLTLPTNSRV